MARARVRRAASAGAGGRGRQARRVQVALSAPALACVYCRCAPPPPPGWPHFSVDTELGAPECLLVSAAAKRAWWRRGRQRWDRLHELQVATVQGQRAAAGRGGLQLTCCLSAGLLCAQKQGLPGAQRPCAGRRSRACPVLFILTTNEVDCVASDAAFWAQLHGPQGPAGPAADSPASGARGAHKRGRRQRQHGRRPQRRRRRRRLRDNQRPGDVQRGSGGRAQPAGAAGARAHFPHAAF